MKPRLPAKLLIATAHGETGNEADVVVLVKDAKGVRCYSNMQGVDAVCLIHEWGSAVAEAAIRSKHDA